MPLPVTEDTPPDMLAGAMDIKVLLPSGRTINMSVERSTPMMDLLVQLTTTHKLSLAAHMTVALSDSGAHLHHLPSTPIGALDTRLLHVTTRNNTSLKRQAHRPNNALPFQTTFRLQVHLPRNQLFVSRVSPDTCLEDVLNLACAEKNLDPSKYELRHPANLQEKLSLSHTLGDYRLQEVTLVASRAIGAPMTPADIMALQKEEEKRRQQVKATGSAYGIAFNKRSRTTVHQSTGSVSSDSLNGRSISPAPSDESAGRSISPPVPLPPTRPARKRRPAPKPPAPVGGRMLPPNISRTQEVVQEDSMTCHSRTSSDSSGYHEASVLSESTDTRTNGGSPADTLPRRSKLPSSNHIATKHKSSTLQHGATNHIHLSRSLSNLTSAAGISSQNMHSTSTTSLASQGHLPRKKKAAPPPPVAPARRAIERKQFDDVSVKTVTGTVVIPITTKTIVEEDIAITENHVAERKVSEPQPKLVNSFSTTSIKRDSQSNMVPPKQDAIPAKVDVIPPQTVVIPVVVEVVPVKTDVVPRKEEIIHPKEDVSPVPSKTISPDVSLPKPVPVDVASVNPVPTSHPPAAQELTKPLPQPKPRILAKPMPQPRQTAPPSVEPRSSTSSAETDPQFQKETTPDTPRIVKVELKKETLLNLDGDSNVRRNSDHKSVGRTFGVGKTMLALTADEESIRTFSVRSSDSRSTVSEASTRVVDDDEFQVLENDVDMFAMPERKVTPDVAFVYGSTGTGRFSDLDFETSSLSSSGNDEAKLASLPKKFVKASSEVSVKRKAPDASSVKSLESFKSLESMKSLDSLKSLDECDMPQFLVGGKSNIGRWSNVEPLSQKPVWQLGDQDTDESLSSSDRDSAPKVSLPDQRNSSPELESSDWEYHLPAPPSAFRDLSSPTTTEFGTVMLADTNVFHNLEPQSLTVTCVADNEPSKRQEVLAEDVTKSSKGKIVPVSVQKDDVSNEEKVIKKEDKVVSVTSNSRYEKQTDLKVTVVVEKRSETKQRFTDEVDKSWEPQQIGVEEKLSSQGGNLINGDVRLRPGGSTKEVFKVNPIFDAQQFDEPNSGKPKVVSGKYVPDEREIIEKSKTLITRSSSADLQSSNTLKNFTISAYEKPKFADTIFQEKPDENPAPTFKKPLTPAAKPAPVVRTNSYTNNDISRPNVVKRSTSYISLARPYARPSSFQSVNRTKSISNLVLEEDIANNELRKSTSEANVNRIALDEEAPLHSLEVLRSILPQLSRSQTALHEEKQRDEPMVVEKIEVAEQLPAVEVVRTERLEVTQLATDTPAVAAQKLSPRLSETSEKVQPAEEVTSRKPDPKPFVYLGPPAINFGSWSERPKVQVSLKSDKDYRIGRQTSDSNTKPTPQVSSVPVNSFRNISVERIPPANNAVETKPTKIEPTPLTMRIVSHTHGSPRRSDIGHLNNSSHSEYNDQEKESLQQGFNGFKSESASRLPIVRAVELKKSASEHFVQLRNMSSTHLNGGVNTSNVSKISVNNYQGSNNMNRHSYIDGDNGHHAFENLGLSKSISTSQLNVDAHNQNNKFVNSSKKYTSVVGINGGGVDPAPAQTPKPAVNVRPNFNSVKVGAYSGPKPMPTVKGFRSTVDETAANATREEQTVKQESTMTTDGISTNSFKSQPLKTLNGIDHMRTTPSWVQRNGTAANEKFGNQVAESTVQPTMIKFKKPVQRPLENKFTNPRDALMDAIKSFGGEDALKMKKKAID